MRKTITIIKNDIPKNIRPKCIFGFQNTLWCIYKKKIYNVNTGLEAFTNDIQTFLQKDKYDTYTN